MPQQLADGVGVGRHVGGAETAAGPGAAGRPRAAPPTSGACVPPTDRDPAAVQVGEPSGRPRRARPPDHPAARRGYRRTRPSTTRGPRPGVPRPSVTRTAKPCSANHWSSQNAASRARTTRCMAGPPYGLSSTGSRVPGRYHDGSSRAARSSRPRELSQVIRGRSKGSASRLAMAARVPSRQATTAAAAPFGAREHDDGAARGCAIVRARVRTARGTGPAPGRTATGAARWGRVRRWR